MDCRKGVQGSGLGHERQASADVEGHRGEADTPRRREQGQADPFRVRVPQAPVRGPRHVPRRDKRGRDGQARPRERPLLCHLFILRTPLWAAQGPCQGARGQSNHN